MRIFRFAMIVLLVVALNGCGAAKIMTASYYRGKLDRIEIGMTKDEVRKIMGKPYKREAYEGTEYWLYYTESTGDPIYGIEYRTDINFTPIAFVDGKVDRWGRNYYENRKARIEADINVKNE